jgi:hypothetical protein
MATQRFERLFVDGPFGDPDGDGVRKVLSVYDAGLLNLPSGRLVACDPYRQARAAVPPFSVTVPPGRYPVFVSHLRWLQPDGATSREYEVAAAMVRLADQPVVAWELGRQADSEHRAFVSLTGTAAFLDAGATATLAGLIGPEEHTGPFATAMDEDHPVNLTDGDFNVVAFWSGYGDGLYWTWIGRAEDGRPVAFVTDFDVIKLD